MSNYKADIYTGYFQEGKGSAAVCGQTMIITADGEVDRPRDSFEVVLPKIVDGKKVGGSPVEGSLKLLIKMFKKYILTEPMEVHIHVAHEKYKNLGEVLAKTKTIVERLDRRKKDAVRDHMVKCGLLRRKNEKIGTKPKCYELWVELIDTILDLNYPDIRIHLDIWAPDYRFVPEMKAVYTGCQGYWVEVMQQIAASEGKSNVVPIKRPVEELG